jgi:hypothetical protein
MISSASQSEHKYTTSMDIDNPIHINIGTINYCDNSNNIFEFLNESLISNPNFHEAEEIFVNIILKQLLSKIPPKHPIISYLQPLISKISEEDKNKPIFQLVQNKIIHFGADNQTGFRPSSLRNSCMISKAYTFDEIFYYYNSLSPQDEEAFRKEAEQHCKGDVMATKCGLAIFDIMSSYVYEIADLGSVLPSMKRMTDAAQNIYEKQKFENIILPMLQKTNILAVQESPDFSTMHYTTCLCFKTMLLPKNKKNIKGTPNSNISIILDKEIAATLLELPEEYKTNKFLKKTSPFIIEMMDRKMLLVVLHGKNPKDEAVNVFMKEKELIDYYKQTYPDINDVFVVGDTNLEKKNKLLPEHMAEVIGLKECSNMKPTTNKQRSNLHAQCGKNKLAQERKDVIMATPSLTETEIKYFPETFDKLLPTLEHPSDHVGLVVKYTL